MDKVVLTPGALLEARERGVGHLEVWWPDDFRGSPRITALWNLLERFGMLQEVEDSEGEVRYEYDIREDDPEFWRQLEGLERLTDEDLTVAR